MRSGRGVRADPGRPADVRHRHGVSRPRPRRSSRRCSRTDPDPRHDDHACLPDAARARGGE
ncbi:hypothetical protein HBB16_06260 [Pseudonocardia sp. MCCB 268]|nr:hypothetical protein [Pseudonocardia cytotoxica]